MRTNRWPGRPWLTLAALLAVIGIAVVVRVASLGLEGHNGDVLILRRWAERFAEVGPLRFYEGSGAIYPAFLYPLGALGMLFEGAALDRAIEGLSIPFDVAIALLLAHVTGGVARATGVLAASLYLLNPAALLAGPIWGQVDAAGTLPLLGALVASAAGRHATAGFLGAVALLVKPQFGLVLWPVFAVAAVGVRPRWRGAGRVVGGALAAYVVVALPLLLDPIRYVSLLGETALRQPFTSLNAFNPWGLLVGFRVPDGPYVGVGTLMLVIGMVAALAPIRHGRHLGALLAAGALVVFAFYFLPTRVHERYLFPAIAVLAPFAVAGRREVVAYGLLSLAFAGSIVYALLDTTPFVVSDAVATWFLSDAGVWVVGGTLVGAAAWWTWRLAVTPPPEVPPPGAP